MLALIGGLDLPKSALWKLFKTSINSAVKHKQAGKDMWPCCERVKIDTVAVLYQEYAFSLSQIAEQMRAFLARNRLLMHPY